MSLDAVGTGGQAGTSSRIENYVGFPNGISGDELDVARRDPGAATRRAAERAVRGRRPAGRARASTSWSSPTGARSRAAAVIVASGARYQRLAVDDLERFEGAGVYYAATDLEARHLRRRRRRRRRWRQLGGPGRDLPRAAGLRRLDRDPRRRPREEHVALPHRADRGRPADRRCSRRTEVRALAGDAHLEHGHARAHADGRARTVACAGLFCFIGADPATEWLARAVALDAGGFVLTDRSLPDAVRWTTAHVPRARAAAVRDVGAGRVRRRRRAARLAQARGGGGRRGIERRAFGPRAPRRRRSDVEAFFDRFGKPPRVGVPPQRPAGPALRVGPVPRAHHRHGTEVGSASRDGARCTPTTPPGASSSPRTVVPTARRDGCSTCRPRPRCTSRSVTSSTTEPRALVTPDDDDYARLWQLVNVGRIGNRYDGSRDKARATKAPMCRASIRWLRQRRGPWPRRTPLAQPPVRRRRQAVRWRERRANSSSMCAHPIWRSRVRNRLTCRLGQQRRDRPPAATSRWRPSPRWQSLGEPDTPPG